MHRSAGFTNWRPQGLRLCHGARPEHVSACLSGCRRGMRVTRRPWCFRLRKFTKVLRCKACCSDFQPPSSTCMRLGWAVAKAGGVKDSMRQSALPLTVAVGSAYWRAPEAPVPCTVDLAWHPYNSGMLCKTFWIIPRCVEDAWVSPGLIDARPQTKEKP